MKKTIISITILFAVLLYSACSKGTGSEKVQKSEIDLKKIENLESKEKDAVRFNLENAFVKVFGIKKGSKWRPNQNVKRKILMDSFEKGKSSSEHFTVKVLGSRFFKRDKREFFLFFASIEDDFRSNKKDASVVSGFLFEKYESGVGNSDQWDIMERNFKMGTFGTEGKIISDFKIVEIGKYNYALMLKGLSAEAGTLKTMLKLYGMTGEFKVRELLSTELSDPATEISILIEPDMDFFDMEMRGVPAVEERGSESSAEDDGKVYYIFDSKSYVKTDRAEFLKQQLLRAVKSDRVERVEELIKKGVELNYGSPENENNPVEYVKSLEMVKLLYEKGADFSISDELEWVDRNSPIINIIMDGSPEMFMYLVPDKVDAYGDELSIAIRVKEWDIVTYLISKNITGQEKFGSLLNKVALRNNVDVAKMLIEKECDVNARDEHNRTSLHHGVKNNNIEMVKILLDAGANIYLKDQWGFRPIEYAAGLNYQPIFQLLKEAELEHPELMKWEGRWEVNSQDPSRYFYNMDVDIISDHSFKFKIDSRAGQSLGTIEGTADITADSAAVFESKDVERKCRLEFVYKKDLITVIVKSEGCSDYGGIRIHLGNGYHKREIAYKKIPFDFIWFWERFNREESFYYEHIQFPIKWVKMYRKKIESESTLEKDKFDREFNLINWEYSIKEILYQDKNVEMKMYSQQGGFSYKLTFEKQSDQWKLVKMVMYL